LAMITFDYGGEERGKKWQNIDYVICERPLTMVSWNFRNACGVVYSKFESNF
jgi:hypothetical protein